MGCGASASHKYKSAKINASTKQQGNLDKDSTCEFYGESTGIAVEPLPPSSKSKKNKLGLTINMESGRNEGCWVDEFADDIVDDVDFDSDGDEDTGHSAWQMASPTTATRRVNAMLRRKLSSSTGLLPSPSIAKFKGAVFKSIVLGQKRVNNYIIVGDLGQGSQGKVKLVEDSSTNRLYAMKIQNITAKVGFSKIGQNDYDPKKEIAIMKKLNHPNIVRLVEVMESHEDGKIYMILEYSEQGPVLELSPQGTCSPLEVETVRSYTRDIVSGLSYLHHQGIVHKDLKPSNLLLKKNGSIAISDFGVSEKNVGSRGNVVDIAGTPAFMAPELQFGVDVGSNVSGYAADMWSLGVIIYVFLIGKVPFWGSDPVTLSHSIANDALFIPSHILPNIESILFNLLEKTPRKRMTMKNLAVNVWLTDGGRQIPLITYEKVDVTDHEIMNAFQQLSLASVVRIKTQMDKMLTRARGTIKKDLSRSLKPRHLKMLNLENGSIAHDIIGKGPRYQSLASDNSLKVFDSGFAPEDMLNKRRSGVLSPIIVSNVEDPQAIDYNKEEDDLGEEDEEVYEVTDVLEEMKGYTPDKPFTFAMVYEDLTCTLIARGPEYLNNDLNIAYGYVADQNRLSYMEDRHVAVLSISPSTRNTKHTKYVPLAFVGVYDGHGGAECSHFLSFILHENICQEPTLWSDPGLALQNAFAATQASFVKYAVSNSVYSGSTACVALIFRDKCVVANVGDSRVVLSRKGRVVEISKDHKPVLKSEMERIHRAGGKIVNQRVQGVLGVSRAFGDIEYNALKEQSWGQKFKDDLISTVPDIFELEYRKKDDEFLLLASDGLWDAMPSQKVVNIFRHFLMECGGNIERAIKLLVEEAKSALNDADNITIQVILFNRGVTSPYSK